MLFPETEAHFSRVGGLAGSLDITSYSHVSIGFTKGVVGKFLPAADGPQK